MNVHFIALGGSAMHNLAIALVKKGYRVTGSDDVIYEPSKTRLARYNLLPDTEGWDVARITPDLDAVILGMHARVDNPELLKAQELGLKIYSYPEYIYEQSKNKLRVVIGGSHGKTTITSMILHVLNFHGMDIDYLVGAQLEGFDTMVKLSHEAKVIIIEGDEYLASPIDRRPKFHLYKADIGVISGIAWDHVNVFPTFESYIEQFKIFINTIMPSGSVIYCLEDELLSATVKESTHPVEKIGYSVPDYEINKGLTRLLYNGHKVDLQVFGRHNLLNLKAAWLVCGKLGISDAQFLEAISRFKGAAKRLELLARSDRSAIYKDFAHSPSKLRATIDAVKSQFPERKLIACMELHTFSSLNKEFLGEYAGTLDRADEPIVFIDMHTFEQKRMVPYTEEDVKTAFKNDKLLFFNDKDKLQEYILQLNLVDSNLLLMSSGTFGGIDLNKISDKL